MEGVVGPDEANCIALEKSQAFVHGVIDAAVGFRKNTNGITLKSARNLNRTILRGAIDNKQFFVGVALFEEGLNGKANCLLRIKRNHNNANFHAVAPGNTLSG
jgi:hypothetical protein